MEKVPEFKCKKCGSCCKNLKPESIFIFPKDVVSLADNLMMSPNDFIDQYCTMNTVKVDGASIELCYLKTEYEDCPFLKKNICSIHSFKPTQCKLTPYNFFSYYRIWSYLQCISCETYPEGCSKENDLLLVKELISTGYIF